MNLGLYFYLELHVNLLFYILLFSTDKLSESVILEVVTKNFKDHLILGEEGGIIGDSLSEYLWCIDPLGLAAL
jgi:hypothetical protein